MSFLNTSATAPAILIVEDEVLIADTLRMKLERAGYRVTATAISCEEAIAAYRGERPEAVLLDIQLSGARTGIDFANFLRDQPDPPPFVYLTSQTDDYFLDHAKQTFPAGYLTKPVQINSLLATLKMVVHNAAAYRRAVRTVEVRHAGVRQIVRVPDILYLKAEHVYVRMVVAGGEEWVERTTLDKILAKIDSPRLVRTHRSYAVNLDRVTGQDGTHLYIGRAKLPVSRRQRVEVERLLG